MRTPLSPRFPAVSLSLLLVAATPAFAGSLIHRVTVVGDERAQPWVEGMSDAFGNDARVARVNPLLFGKNDAGTDVVIIAQDTVAKARRVAETAATLPTVDRLVFAPSAAATAAECEGIAALAVAMKADYLPPVPGADRDEWVRRCADAARKPVDAAFSPEPGFVKQKWAVTPVRWGAYPAYQDATTGLTVVAPALPNKHRAWAWLAGDVTADGALATEARLLLDRGFFVVLRPTPEGETVDATLKVWSQARGRLQAAGLAANGLLVAQGKGADAALAWAAATGVVRGALILSPESIDLTRLGKLGAFPAAVDVDTPAGREFFLSRETGAGTLIELSSRAPMSARTRLDMLLSHAGFLTNHEQRLLLEPVVPQYPWADPKTLAENFGKSRWGDAKPYFVKSTNYFPAGFEAVRKRWRDELGLKVENGVVVGPKVLLAAPKEGVPAGSVLLKDCFATLKGLTWEWREHCVNADQQALLKPLINDLSLLAAKAVKDANDAEQGIADDIRNEAEGLSRSAYLLDPAASEWIGALVMHKNANYRYNPSPYSNMDALRDLVSMGYGINFFRTDEARLRHIREVQNWFDRCFRGAITTRDDGAPDHHGLWHYAYASYSLGHGWGLMEEFHRMGAYASARCYERMRRAGNLGIFLGNGAHFKNLMPADAEGRAGGGGTWIRDLEYWTVAAARLGDGKSPTALHPECVAYLAALNPGHPLVTQARKEGVAFESVPLSRYRTVNSGAIGVRNYGPLQVTASCSSDSFGACVEFYRWFNPNYHALYSKWGSLWMRSSEKDGEDWPFLSGYDHSHRPGATSEPRTPYEIITPNRTVAIHTSGMGGGTYFADNDTGIVGMEQKRGPGPVFKKSFFFFGDRVTTLTSNVARWDAKTAEVKIKLPWPETPEGTPSVTTLYQWRHEPEKRPTLDGAPAPAFPYAADSAVAGFRTLTDRHGNAYVVHPSPHLKLHVAGREQSQFVLDPSKLKPEVFKTKFEPERGKSPFGKNTYRGHPVFDGMAFTKEFYEMHEPVKGNFELAWLEHVKRDGADDAGCAWTLLVRGGVAGGAKLAASLASPAPAYAILQCDGAAHAVHDRETDTTACLTFRDGVKLKAAGELLEVSSQAFLMVRREGEARRKVSVVNAQQRDHRALRITLKGDWAVSGPALLENGHRVSTRALPGGETAVIVTTDVLGPVPLAFDPPSSNMPDVFELVRR